MPARKSKRKIRLTKKTCSNKIKFVSLQNHISKMTTDKKIEYWVTISNDDLKVAETMLKNRHNVYTGFMCHQVIEKIFKAGYVKLKNETAPYSHNLIRLAEQACFYDLLSEEQKTFLSVMNPLNIESRYPDYTRRIANSLTNERCKQIFEQTKQMQQWIKEQIL
jgi:HEPN domain-containing protein